MNPLVVLDLETGGLNYKENPITEIAFYVVDMKTLKVIEQYQSFVQPYDGLVITEDALNATQLSMKQINSGELIHKVLNDFATIMSKHKKSKSTAPILVGHNLDEFDIPYFEYTFEQRNKNLYDYVSRSSFDTLKMAKLYERGMKGADKLSYKLGVVCERYGIPLTGAHGALADVDATYKLFKKLTNRFKHGEVDTIGTTAAGEDMQTRARRFFEF